MWGLGDKNGAHKDSESSKMKKALIQVPSAFDFCMKRKGKNYVEVVNI